MLSEGQAWQAALSQRRSTFALRTRNTSSFESDRTEGPCVRISHATVPDLAPSYSEASASSGICMI